MKRAALGLLLLMLLPACAVDLAMSAGATVPHGQASATRAVWTGELRSTLQGAGAIETGMWVVDHLTLGLELQGRAARARGALYTGGASLGLAFGDGRYQAYTQLESGIPLGWSHRLQGYYVGLSAGALWPLVPRAPISGPNKVLRLLEQRAYLGPWLRYRREDLEQRPLPSPVQHDVVLGLQMRVLIGTDLF